jgi:hypothetical protein
MGIEPTPEAWEAAVLPLNYARGETCILCARTIAWQSLAYRGFSAALITDFEASCSHCACKRSLRDLLVPWPV